MKRKVLGLLLFLVITFMVMGCDVKTTHPNLLEDTTTTTTTEAPVYIGTIIVMVGSVVFLLVGIAVMLASGFAIRH